MVVGMINEVDSGSLEPYFSSAVFTDRILLWREGNQREACFSFPYGLCVRNGVGFRNSPQGRYNLSDGGRRHSNGKVATTLRVSSIRRTSTRFVLVASTLTCLTGAFILGV